ncbi:MAG: 2Fe-2S iron-sulfur cluster-binding protein [Dehalococcoidia bacterium]|nr:2Fe-2S iron-sulfur cluster-binding protein [Dehalococcoidia bacterium]
MVKLTIDGRQTEAKEGAMVLDAARALNIYIPTLCAHESVSAYGACRLCTVDITTRSGRNRMVTSCLYPVEEGLAVKTTTEKIAAHRRMLIQLLLARCPESPELKAMAKKLGADDTPFPKEDPAKNHNCILCALCTRACDEVVGQSAISFVNRGVAREMAIPFYNDSDACIACGSCFYICPTNAIQMTDKNGKRRFVMPHNTMEFELAQCAQCGRYHLPKRQIAWMAKKSGQPLEFFARCISCREEVRL